jgi:hypothetical protein
MIFIDYQIQHENAPAIRREITGAVISGMCNLGRGYEKHNDSRSAFIVADLFV